MKLLCKDLVFGYNDALGCVDHVFDSGSITAIVGRNGVGKSTFLQTIAGEINPISGSVSLVDRDIRSESDRFPVSRIADPVFYPELTIREHILLAKQYRTESPAAGDAIWHIDSLLDRLPGSLSSGQSQRCYLAIQLGYCGDFVALDEPERHLDSTWQMRLCEVIPMIASSGRGVLLASHSPVLLELASHIIDLDALRQGGIADE